jgi:hypothetical protein
MALVKSLRHPPPPTPLPHRACAGSGVSIKSVPLEWAEAHHGGDGCVFCCVYILIQIPTYVFYFHRSHQNHICCTAVKLLD